MGTVDDLEVRLLTEALEAIGKADSSLRTRLLAKLAQAKFHLSSLEHRQALSDQAVAMASRIGDPTTQAAAWIDRLAGLATSAVPEEGLAIAAEALRLAGCAGDRELQLRARQMCMGYLLELGDMDRFRTELAIYGSAAQECRLTQHLWRLPFMRSNLAVVAGDLEHAERLAEEGRRLGLEAQHPDAGVFHDLVIAYVRCLQGRQAEVEDLARRYVADPKGEAGWRCVLAQALCAAGRVEEASRLFEVVAEGVLFDLPRDDPPLFVLANLAYTCAMVGDVRRAAILYPLLARHRNRYVQVRLTAIGFFGSAAQYLGLLSCTMSRWDDALRDLEHAIEMDTRIGGVAFVALSRFHHARALWAVGGEMARVRAVDEMDEAKRLAGACGLRPWHFGADLPRHGATPATMTVDPLSPREREVAALVAEGLTNIEIAGRLFLSKRTVESHVDSIRRKLRLDSRAGLVSWVIRRT
jgi:DNA-binding CsgD family transcriptional regulator/tetratricopeptide (TPR) repeat protein